MKKFLSGIGLAVALMAAVVLVPVSAKAEDVSVSGTIEAGSTSDIIKLNTSSGVMELKVDSNSDMGGKILLPGATISVKITYGSDAYWHIKAITGSKIVSNVTVNKSDLTTVTGTITDSKNGNIVTLKTSYGDMSIKLDDTTDLSGCRFLAEGGTYTMKIGYGSDAYWHAVSISDSSTASYSSSSSSSSTTTTNASAETAVTGTVSSKSTGDVIVLNTAEGEMQIKLDQYNGAVRVIVQGQKLKVGINYGNEYWHAAYINVLN